MQKPLSNTVQFIVQRKRGFVGEVKNEKRRWSEARVSLISFAARQNREVGKVLNEFPATPSLPRPRTVMIVCKYLVAWGTTPDRAKIREAPAAAAASRRPLTCAQANRRLFRSTWLPFSSTFREKTEEKCKSRITHTAQNSQRRKVF